MSALRDRRSSGSVARWLGGSVARWLRGSVARWLGGSVARWFGGSVAQWLTSSELLFETCVAVPNPEKVRLPYIVPVHSAV